MRLALGSSVATLNRGTPEKLSFFLLNGLDLVLTVVAVSLGLHELNPFMKYLLTQPLQLLLFKLAVPLLISWLVPNKLLLPAIALLVLVVSWDIKELALAIAVL